MYKSEVDYLGMQVTNDHWHSMWLHNFPIKPALIKTFPEHAPPWPSSNQHMNLVWSLPLLATTWKSYVAVYFLIGLSTLLSHYLPAQVPRSSYINLLLFLKRTCISSPLCLCSASPSAQKALPPPTPGYLLLVLQHYGDHIIYHTILEAFESTKKH